MNPIIVALYAGVILYFMLKIIPRFLEFQRFRKGIRKLPGPRGLPIIGISYHFLSLRLADQIGWALGYLKEYQYTTEGLFGYRLGPEAIVHVNSPRQLEYVLPNTSIITKASYYRLLKPWLGNGLITSTGEKWHRDRKMITPSFHFTILEGFLATFQSKVQEFVQRVDDLLKKNPGKPIDYSFLITKLSLDTIIETSLGVNLNDQGDEGVQYIKNVHDILVAFYNRLFRPWHYPDIIYYSLPVGRKYKQMVKQMHAFTLNIIKKRLEKRKKEEEKKRNEIEDDIGLKQKKVLLDYLLDASESSERPLTLEEIREQVDTFAFAGHDTTASAILFTLYRLGNEPEIQEKCYEEIQSVFGDSTEVPTLQQLSELKYLERVIKEVLRIYPPVPFVARLAEQDLKIDDHVIPRGTTVSISSYLTHRLPFVWPDPEKFDPDRFLPENLKDKHPYAYIPFSAGGRNCIGQKFALAEMKICVSTVLRKWKLKSITPVDKMEVAVYVVLQAIQPTDAYFIPRN